MKIGLDVNAKEAVKQYTSIPESPKFSQTEKAGAIRLDITGMYTDVNAYGVHGRTTEDLKKEASNIDVSTVRNYMTVMSNTMSGEDYKKAMEDGFDPADMDPESRETIMDHIKAVMAESGQVVAGFNDDLSDEKLKNITGRDIDVESIKRALREADLPDTPDNTRKISEAVNMMAEIDSLTDGSIKYMVENELKPTVGNIYTSTFSASGDGSRQARGYYGEDMPGYLARKADSVDLTELKPQLEKLIDQMDIEDATRDELINDAGWLIEKGIPVTEQKIESLRQINSIVFPVSARTIVAASMQAIAQGLTPKDANLAPTENNTLRQAYELQNKILDASINREQTRLIMSIEANIKLIESGVKIDTDSIEDTINALKEQQNKMLTSLFKEDNNAEVLNEGNKDGNISAYMNTVERKVEVYTATTAVLRELPQMPAALIGKVSSENDGAFTLNRAHSVGSDYKARYEAASQTYEAVGTEIRRDLGDSINKAFRNVDDILKDIGLDVNEENRRAVRILGYNSMVINEESIQRVKAADNKLTGVLKALTPGKTLQLIREGVNPLDLDIDELVNHISETDHDPKREAEKYSRFLYKLEQSGKITDEERTSYIGIYRMLNRIERTDHAAIGKLLESNTDMTFGNLLRAMRSSGKVIDAGIDDSFGMLSERIPKGISITDQIEEAFKNKISEEDYNKLDEEYLMENVKQLRSVATADDAVISELLGSKVNITPNTVLAQMQQFTAPNDLFRNLKTYASRTDRKLSEAKDSSMTSGHMESDLTDAMEKFTESLTDKEYAINAYSSLTQTMTETLQIMTDYSAQSLIDLRSISLMHKQISLISSHSRSENYHIPVMMDGKYTDINLRLIHGSETGLVTASMDTEVFGAVQAQIRVKGESVDVGFITSGRQNQETLKPIGDEFIRRLADIGYEDCNIRFVTGDPGVSVKHRASDADNNNEAVETKALYKIAKQFIYTIRSGGNL
ncbi:MAG: DUF6240 domain-containing protein [Lachnospiraceae bacterium]|nr:DUF6240 domain-containing protein [Lachnospiraceae bacterium]